MRTECKHVELKLVPQPVISLLQQLSKSQLSSSTSKGKGPSHPRSRESREEMDWMRINPKLTSTLMQFQREGVE